MDKDWSELILRFFTEDIGGILITDAAGGVLFEDARARLVRQGRTNWEAACPPPREGQRGERWDLQNKDNGQSYGVVSSTVSQGSSQVITIRLFEDFRSRRNVYVVKNNRKEEIEGLYEQAQ